MSSTISNTANSTPSFNILTPEQELNEAKQEIAAIKYILENYGDPMLKTSNVPIVKRYYKLTEETLGRNLAGLQEKENRLSTQVNQSIQTALLPSVSVRNLLLQRPVAPNVPFTDVLNEPLHFRIPVTDQRYVNAYPEIFTLGLAEYEQSVDSWLNFKLVSYTSEQAVIGLDQNWYAILKEICDVAILLDEHDPSSQLRLRPDVVVMKISTLILKGEAKASIRDISEACKELTSKFKGDAYKVFPKGCSSIPAIVTCNEAAYIRQIVYEFGNYSHYLCYEFKTRDLKGRVEFIVVIIKLCRWILAQTEAVEGFHLPLGKRVQTRNKHHATWNGVEILKEFYHASTRQIPMEIIKNIFTLKLPNIEWGITNCNSITITRVGMRLSDAIQKGRISKDMAYQHIVEAVNQLHFHGYAHCDICVDNIFVDNSNIVFLGDLEYCQKKMDPPPIDLRRSDIRAQTAEQLDNIQLDKLRDELACL